MLRLPMLLLAFFLAGTAAAQSKIYYVSSQATDTGDGSSWADATTLTKALDKAVAGDQIWVQGFETLTGGNLYVAPKEGFAVKSGVQLYGGFAGTESRLSQRVTLGKPYQLKYRSVLSGDIQKNDTVGSVDLIFPANGTRSDNATHVLSVNLDPTQASGNNNTYPTVINGFSIGNGQAAGTGDAGKGGGIYVYGDNSKGGVFRIERCFLISNYATQGGAVYVSSEVQNVNNGESLINQCVIYNNAAGERAAVENQGGGIYLAGEATVVNTSIFNNGNGGVRLSPKSKVVNVTIARNTGAGVDMTAGGSGDAHVYNSIIWGNTQLYLQNDPGFRNSAYHEVTADDKNSNVYVAKENRDAAAGPMFDAPSVKTSYDRDFNWRESAYPLWSWNVLEGSAMIDKGHNDYYDQNVYGSEDMAGNPRISGDRISVGAYEYQYLPATRIRYVKPTATGTGDGSSWDNASGDLQKMIDDLADNNVSQQAGEVWVAAGTYKPQSQLISGMNYSASFRMRDGISVYGGFAGNETSKQERAKGTMPWDFTNVTVLEAAYYESKLAWTNSKWTVGSDSRHVVWFAPMSGESDFTRITTLDGVTVQGGYAQGNTGLDDFKTDCGAGVYMDGANAYLSNCIVRENYATGNGGGVYLKNGRVQTSLIYNNNADADGGAVYVENRGLVYRSMLTNNSALNGAGVYLYNGAEAGSDDPDHPEYLILSTCVVSNNTVRGNGAVYCDKGGVLMQNTITNNECVTATDATDVNASQTGGIYVDEYALVLNSVLWNNQMQGGTNIPMYARNPSAAKVRFLYNAISGVNNAVWNNTLQEQTLSLVDENAGKQDDGTSIGPRFTEPAADMNFSLNTDYGVQDEWKDGLISYYWKPISGSNLWARGMALGQLPSEVVLSPELDIEGKVYAQKPAVGAFSVGAPGIKHATVGDSLVVYVDVNCTEPDHDGSSWAKGFRSLNNAISYLAGLDADIVGTKKLVVRVLEGDIWPRYAFTNNDPKTATITVPVTTSGQPVYLYGGYHRTTDNNTVIRDPLTYRSVINGNTEGKDITQGLYHCITVERGAKLVLDGFHVINGYAAGEASRQYGAGLLAHAGSTVTVRNCIFENNTAQEGAAIDAREATLTMENCVVNNNTNTTTTASVINANTLTMEHVTVANNIGAAPANTNNLYESSFSAGNTDAEGNLNTTNNNTLSLSTIGADGAKNFANPTNKVGATLGFDTYLGGYSSFRPLTSSENAGNNIINKAPASTLTTDITAVNDRDLGGVPDLGAYEADLPKSGRVIYVRQGGTGEGLSWGDAMGDINAALQKGVDYNKKLSEADNKDANKRAQVWVAAGEYTGTITGNPDDVNDDSNIHSQPYAYKMVEGVNVYGGFPNSGAPGENDRDPKNHKTILQAQDTKPEYPAEAQYSAEWKNVGRVLVQPNHFTVETVWDGLVFRYGSLNTGYRYSITGNIMNLDTKVIGECGGAGVYMMGNSVLENCVIENNLILADKKNIISNSGGIHTVAGGVFCRGGVIRNCQIINNSIRVYSQQKDENGAAFSYGGGLYILNDDNYTAAIFNSLISGNRAEALEWNNETVTYHTMAIGAGACQISGNFYNNTIVGNTAKTENSTYSNIMCGGMFVYNTAEIYNCIIYNNKEEGGRNIGISNPKNLNLQVLSVDIPEGSSGNKPNNDGYSIMKERIHVYYSNVGYTTDADSIAHESSSLVYGNVTYASRNNVSGYPNFVDESTGDYHLLTGSPAINTGTEVIPNAIIPDYDADYTNRIKDCGIDMGAFESTNEGNVLCTETQEDGITIFTYYVSQNGVGLRSGENPANAACATKLQAILTDAGKKVSTNTSASAIVKVAGYEDASFVYNANTLASAIDPQSYTYVIPEGVTLMGGYYDGNYNDGDYEEGSGWDDATGDYMRNPMKFRTVLSAIAKPSQGSTITQEVNGYHTVTFGAWPGTAALTKSAMIDGVWLEDGSATSLAGAGNPNTRGGAIVPSGAHVRNCVVRNCAATEGGGLYLMPGATVSGTLIMDNSAENGGGVYADATSADNTLVDADSRAHILSSTIAGNTAFTSGGGLYMEDGAVMNVNTVIFGNTAGSDKNVSGVTNTQFADNKLSSVYGIDGKTNFYPFNDCFVETQEMPSDFENTRLESDSTLYFTGDFYQLKDYSLLIKHGLKNKYQEKETQADPSLVTTFNVAKSDMQNIVRVQTGNGAERLDAGAFAYEGGILPEDLFTRIFVSQTTNVTLPDNEDMNKYLGRSFYTSFSTLEDALGYIRSMRKDGKANDNTHFEILVAGGTYKPSNERTTTAAVTHDQRLYSFDVPQNVSIYGGFRGDELYGSLDGQQSKIPTTSDSIQVDNMGDITDILNARTYSDFNQNGINEPWELANQTILSGQINASSTAQNAYHVVFTDKGTATTVNPVVLDGLTVMNGETDNQLSISTAEDEQGRGGGIYSNGVTYTISRCRLLNNTAVRGGAVFVRDADLNLSGCILAGNQTVTNAAQGTNTLTSRGGAAYVSGISRVVSLRAVNTLWANNESADEGGAIGTNYAGVTSAHDPFIYILNNTFVRNKAAKNPVLYNHNGKSELVNTLIWGNDGASYDDATSVAEIYSVSHCASDVDYVNKFASGNHNILLSIDNMGDNGPRFTNPSTVAGVAGNSASSLWNPAAISVLTDAGNGTEHNGDQLNSSETDHTPNGTTGAYQEWFSDNGYLGQNGVTEAYITGGNYSRYSVPYGEDNTPMCKPIDIGLYEYQYVSNFSTMLKIYVDTLSVGNGSGDSWANATDDLRGAIVGASNPTVQAGTRRIFVRDGKYTWSRLSAGSAYILNMSDNSLSDLLILKGSCTGSGEQQDFSKPTVVRNDVETRILMSVSANNKNVVFEGFTFANHSASVDAKGMEVSVQSSGSLTLKNCGFRQNPVGLNVEENSGPVLIYNTLFADGGTGLAADERTTVVNATFAQNVTDLTGTPKGIYNSVAWKNGKQNLTTDTEKKNVAIPDTVDNDNVLEGPNFVDPDNADVMSRDYRIRPNLLLLNKGNKKHYTDYALGLTAADAAIPADEKDLANNVRLTGDEIDVGAYEYEATLKPIVYVKADLTGTADGNSWTTALGDLQGAVDLAGIYVNGNPGEHAYVFVHNNYRDAGLLNLSMPGVKVYGGMNDETSAVTDVSGIVSDLLTQRKGMLESTGRSSLQDVTLGTDVVVDGFVVNGAATVNNGILSTSILNGAVAGRSDGVLYNSLALNSVSGVKAVNVTATGTIADVTGSGNNRASASENTYVTADYWKYQLMETDADNLDKGTDATTKTYIDKVGHSRDLIGNKRIRNTVDNGCFETWNITTDGAQITATDKPVGQSVVYVRQGKELSMAEEVYPEGQNFNPGYLLLEHQAGLRGNGNYISLNNNFAVERNVAAGGNDLAVMPFDVTGVTPDAGYSRKRYNGSMRAAYDYTFDSSKGKAWTDQDFASRGETEGFLIENTSAHDIKVRFSGTSYTEGGADKSVKSVVLMKYNFNEPWNSTSTGGNNRFTHKENMSWNLFGSPYLCAMNYGDMEYGRVLYGYVNGTYQTVNTANETEGYIPAGDAVFTQTATLKDKETFTVATSASQQGKAYASAARLQLTLSPVEATRATADEAPASDMLQLNAVPADEARQDFDLGADGVKWMSTAAVPQLYAVRSGNRYSLLSAVSEEGETALGVTASKAGTYQLGIAGNEGYETVELTDHETGRTVDLTTSAYTFTLPADTCLDHRFTLRFRTLDDEGADGGIRIRLQDDGSICVSGLEPGQRIQAYSVGGQLEWKHVATESQCVFRLQRGVHVVEVREGGTKRAVSKFMVP